MKKAESSIAAAVLVLVVDSGTEPNNPPHHQMNLNGKTLTYSKNAKLILTVRSSELEHHKGEISFPGGIHETSDESLQTTALREAEEELGIDSSLIEIHGPLQSTFTLSTKFQIQPFLASIKELPLLTPSLSEIAEVLVVDLRDFLIPENTKHELFSHEGIHYKMQTFLIGKHRVWGATARILEQFLKLLK